MVQNGTKSAKPSPKRSTSWRQIGKKGYGWDMTLIGIKEGVIRAWAIRKKPASEQWDGDLIKNMKGTPAKPNPQSQG